MSLLSRALLSVACLLMINLSEVNSQEDLSRVSNTFIRKCNTLFRIADANKDGLFTNEDMKQLIHEFAKVAHLNKTYEKYLYDVLVPKIVQVLKDITNTNSKHLKITREAMIWWMIIYRNKLETQIGQNAEMKFKISDLDDDGVISQSEHAIAFKIVRMGPGETLMSFRALDINGDGVICLEEYRSRLISFHTSDRIDCPSKYIYGPLD